MAPSRARGEPSGSVAGSSRERQHERNPYANRPGRRSVHEDAPPLGVQKLKSALRQSKRLLAKDKLAADVRVETERRSKALEADLARAEHSRKERQYATKYHKVKFFERQKIARKISQTKRDMETAKEEEEKEKLELALYDLRVDLNYILHFPKTRKYVSLFPPEVRGPESTAAPVAASTDDNEERSKLREMIRGRMECGELSTEPESDFGKGRKYKQLVSDRKGADAASSIKTRARARIEDVTRDDFFGEDDDEGSQQSGASHDS